MEQFAKSRPVRELRWRPRSERIPGLLPEEEISEGVRWAWQRSTSGDLRRVPDRLVNQALLRMHRREFRVFPTWSWGPNSCCGPYGCLCATVLLGFPACLFAIGFPIKLCCKACGLCKGTTEEAEENNVDIAEGSSGDAVVSPDNRESVVPSDVSNNGSNFYGSTNSGALDKYDSSNKMGTLRSAEKIGISRSAGFLQREGETVF